MFQALETEVQIKEAEFLWIHTPDPKPHQGPRSHHLYPHHQHHGGWTWKIIWPCLTHVSEGKETKNRWGQSRDMTNKNNTNANKNSLVSAWRGMPGSLLSLAGKLRFLLQTTCSLGSAAPSACCSGLVLCHLMAWVMLSPGCSCFYCIYPRFFLKSIIAGIQPCRQPHYLSSYHSFYCPHWVGKIPFYAPRQNVLLQSMSLSFLPAGLCQTPPLRIYIMFILLTWDAE